DDEPGDGEMDEQPSGGVVQRVADGVQRDDVDALCGDPGSTLRVLSAGAFRARSGAGVATRAIRLAVGRVVCAAGGDGWVSPGVRRSFARRGCGGETGRVAGPEIPACRGPAGVVGARCSGAPHAVLAAIPPREPTAGIHASDGGSGIVFGTACGL